LGLRFSKNGAIQKERKDGVIHRCSVIFMGYALGWMIQPKGKDAKRLMTDVSLTGKNGA